jgi:hypothetical protein
MLMI